MKTTRYSVVVLAILALVVGVWLSAPAYSQYQEDPNPGGGSGGCYCGQTACGCQSPPSGCVLYFSCSCSPIQCTRSCSYECG